MKTFILIILSTILFSCEDGPLITRAYKPNCDANRYIRCIDYYEVSKIENKNESLCKYYLTSDSWAYFDYEISFVDSIGKFEVADKLYISFDKIK